MLASTTITLQPDSKECLGLAGNGTALVTISQEGDGNAELPGCADAESSTYCLYFLVCAASDGPLAGLFKAGIADRFPIRYRQHAKTWGPFNLTRSALLRVRSRREAEHLERALRGFFGDPLAESRARAAGITLTSEDFIAMGSWRRHPGRCDDGYTEFYDVGCLTEMLFYVEKWRTGCGGRRTGTRLQREINPADCAVATRADGSPRPLTIEARRELRAQRRAHQQRELKELDAQVEVRVGQLLDLALAYEKHLVWVHLRFWHWLRDLGRHGFSNVEGMVDLYFDGFGTTPFGTDADSERRSAARVRFEADVAFIAAPLESARRCWWDWRRSGSVCSLREPDPLFPYLLPHPVCEGKPLLRLEPCLVDLNHPFLARFEALARRVESRHRWEQTKLCWG